MQTLHRSLRKAVSVLFTLLLIFAIFASSSAATISDNFTYDAGGNMINGSGFIFVYNDANQFVKIINESDSSIVAEYFYDANGQRVKKIEDGVTTYYIGDYIETRVNGSTVDNTSYYFANNERVARKDPESSMFYYHGDHLGSTSVVTNESGAQSEKGSYYPYGSIKERVGEGSTYLFTDQEFDDESGLYYYGARYYNPELTRFTQPDTITQDVYNPQNLNKYAYVLNNPLVFIDPTGHQPVTLPMTEDIPVVRTNLPTENQNYPLYYLGEDYKPGSEWKHHGTYYDSEITPLEENKPKIETLYYWELEQMQTDRLTPSEYNRIPKYYEGTTDPNRELWRQYEPVYDEDMRFIVSTSAGYFVGGLVEAGIGGTSGGVVGGFAGLGACKVVEGLYPPSYYERSSGPYYFDAINHRWIPIQPYEEEIR